MIWIVIGAILAGLTVLVLVEVMRARTPGLPETSPRDLLPLVASLRRPGFVIRRSEEATTSWMGGAPPESDGFVWPEKDGRPLTFLACIDLAALEPPLEWLPLDGRLLFFYDVRGGVWGFDPNDRGSWAVIHVPEDAVIDTPAVEPDAHDPAYEFRWVRFEPVQVIPDVETDEVGGLDLSSAEWEALYELRTSIFTDDPHHLVGGHPHPVQGPDMDLECQLASGGVNAGTPEPYTDPKHAHLRAGASDWRLLLQLDEDGEVIWGDCGMIYFWVRASEARRGDFTNAWFILQSA